MPLLRCGKGVPGLALPALSNSPRPERGEGCEALARHRRAWAKLGEGRNCRRGHRLFAIMLDQIAIAIEVRFIREPVERAACLVHPGDRHFFVVDALDHHAQALAGGNAAPRQFLGELARFNIAKHLPHRF